MIYSNLTGFQSVIQSAYDTISMIPLEFVYNMDKPEDSSKKLCEGEPLYRLFDSTGRPKQYVCEKIEEGEYDGDRFP